MTEQRVSNRYARALLETATTEGISEKVLDDFTLVVNTLKAHKELKSITESPIFHQWKKKKMYQEIFDKKISDLLMHFLILLLDKRRGDLISSIAVQYRALFYKQNSILPVVIISAVEMKSDSQEKIIKKLTESTKMKILPEYKVSADIKGGFLIRVDDWIYDASVKNQLELLFDRLATGVDVKAS
jgi:F-type H+-transporting ATPase subunit delta